MAWVYAAALLRGRRDHYHRLGFLAPFTVAGDLGDLVTREVLHKELHRSGESLADLGLDTKQLRGDLLRGALLAAVVGGAGLGPCLVAHAAGVNLTVAAEDLPGVWWRLPVLVLAALQNAVLEEVLVAGYSCTGWSSSAGRPTGRCWSVRGSYHLYQGFGPFIGNAVMGLVFGWIYARTRRVMPLVVAHALLDIVAFVGFSVFGKAIGLG